MPSDSRTQALRFGLLTALGLLPFAACGGSSEPGTLFKSQPNGEAGSPDESAGAPSDGGSGGASNTGGRPTTGGRSPAGGRPTTAGAGGAITTGGRSPTGGMVSTAGAGGAIITGGRSPAGGRVSMAGAGGAIATGGAHIAGGTSAGTGSVSHECTPVNAEPPSGAAPAPDAPIAIPIPPFVDCSGNWRHRPVVQECPSGLPRAEPTPSTGGDDLCEADADCTDAAHGMCTNLGQVLGNHCVYGCVADSECSDGQICNCGPLIGACAPATCTSDADCNGLFCASHDAMPGCGIISFACQTPEDQCMSDADCTGSVCTFREGHRICANAACSIGRPFLVEGSERLADRAYRSDWLDSELTPSVEPLADDVRAGLAEAWTRIGLMEHASIAAFARFSLELLALGAPANLLDSSAQAMRDETAHARQAFALASAYAGEARGPGALAVNGRLLELDLGAIAVTTFLEGCIGETAAALEAREAAELAGDPLVRAVLERVAEEEARHALLAYEFLRWALSRSDVALVRDLETILNEEIARTARAAAACEIDAAAAKLAAHGILPESRRLELRKSVLSDVVAPCLAEIARTALAPQRSAASSAGEVDRGTRPGTTAARRTAA